MFDTRDYSPSITAPDKCLLALSLFVLIISFCFRERDLHLIRQGPSLNLHPVLEIPCLPRKITGLRIIQAFCLSFCVRCAWTCVYPAFDVRSPRKVKGELPKFGCQQWNAKSLIDGGKTIWRWIFPRTNITMYHLKYIYSNVSHKNNFISIKRTCFLLGRDVLAALKFVDIWRYLRGL